MATQGTSHEDHKTLEEDEEMQETTFGFAINKVDFIDRILDLVAISGTSIVDRGQSSVAE
jgi:hypothetical protein